MGNWVGISNAKALGIVWRDRTRRNAKQKCHHYNYGCLCSQVNSNCTAAAFLLVLARILSLQTIPSAIAVLIRPSSRLVLVMSNSERKIFSLQVVTTVRVSVGNVYTSTKHPAILFRPFPLRLRRLGHHVLCGLLIVACPCPKSYLFLFFFFNFGSNSWKIQRKS